MSQSTRSRTRRSAGEGSISHRTDGRWQGALQVDGRRRIVYGRTRQEVAAKLDDLKRQASLSGALPEPGNRTVSDLLDAFLQVKAPNVKPRTLADYAETSDRYLRPVLGRLRLSKVTPDRIARLYASWQSQGKAKTALKIHRVLSQALDMGVRWGWLPSNPCDPVDTPRYQPGRKELWTPEQLRTFLDRTRDHWLHPVWTLLAYTGCRLGEVLALEWTDVDLVIGRITIAKSTQRINGAQVTTEPKTRAGIRAITLPRESVETLRLHAERRLATGSGSDVYAHLVFLGERGGPLSHSTVGWALTHQCQRLGLPHISPHGLRHLHASLLLAQRLPIPDVSRRLGHANSAITMSIYAHAISGDDSAATEAIGRALAR